MASTRRVVVPYFFVFPPHESRPLDDDALRLLNRSRVVSFTTPEAEHSIHARQAAAVQLPLSRFVTASAGNGHVNVRPDVDGALRHVELVIRLGDTLYPSLTLETARLALGLPRTRIRFTPDQEVQIGSTVVPTDDTGALLLTYYGKAGTFPTIPAVDVLTGSSPPAVKDHVVLVGFTAHGLMDVRPTPFDAVMPGVESLATGVANLLAGRGLRQLAGLEIVETLAVLLLALVGPLLLPRIGAIWGTVVALSLAVATTGLVHMGFRSRHLGLSCSAPGRPRRRPRRQRHLPGVDREPGAPVDQAGVPPVRAAGGGRAARAGPVQAQVRRGTPHVDCSFLGYPGVHDVLRAAHPGGGRGEPSRST